MTQCNQVIGELAVINVADVSFRKIWAQDAFLQVGVLDPSAEGNTRDGARASTLGRRGGWWNEGGEETVGIRTVRRMVK